MYVTIINIINNLVVKNPGPDLNFGEIGEIRKLNRTSGGTRRTIVGGCNR